MEVNSQSEQLLFTTVRIETTSSAGLSGTGTGFIFTYTKASRNYPFIVTNKHVVKDTQTGQFVLTQAIDEKPNIGVGCIVRINEFEGAWFGHPDENIDVAVAPLNVILNAAQQNNTELFFRSIGSELIPSDENINGLDALEEVVFVGYPNGIWDEKNLLPILRR